MTTVNIKLYEWVKKTIDETSGLTQKGLAKATGMNPATINRMLYGRRHIRAEEVPLIESYLGQKYQQNSEYIQSSQTQPRAFAEATPSQDFGHTPVNKIDIPVYQTTVNDDYETLVMDKEKVVDWVGRHPAQKGNNNAFAVYISTNSFEPRYYTGEMVYIHSGRPPVISQDCLIKKQESSFILCRYLGQRNQDIILSNLSGTKEFSISASDVKALYAVVGRG